MDLRSGVAIDQPPGRRQRCRAGRQAGASAEAVGRHRLAAVGLAIGWPGPDPGPDPGPEAQASAT